MPPSRPALRADHPVADAGGERRDVEVRVASGWTWPAAIALGLALVVVVNVIFIWVAVGGADPVDPSYAVESQR